jgi:hypothetical protein
MRQLAGGQIGTEIRVLVPEHADRTMSVGHGGMKSRHGRRQFVQGMLACGCNACLSPAMSAQVPVRRYYCAYGAVSVGEPDNLIELKQAAIEKLKTLLRTRSTAIIEYIEAEDELLPQFFGRNAPIYYDPGTNANAYTDYTYIDRAFIALGEGFITAYANKMMLQVAGILAHEEGHIYQIRSPLARTLTDRGGFQVKYLELHADYMAGAYLAWREKVRPQSPSRLLFDFFAELPGTPSDYSSYHGSPVERYAAFNEGRYDFRGLRLGSGAPADAAALQGLKYIELAFRS